MIHPLPPPPEGYAFYLKRAASIPCVHCGVYLPYMTIEVEPHTHNDPALHPVAIFLLQDTIPEDNTWVRYRGEPLGIIGYQFIVNGQKLWLYPHNTGDLGDTHV